MRYSDLVCKSPRDLSEAYVTQVGGTNTHYRRSLIAIIRRLFIVVLFVYLPLVFSNNNMMTTESKFHSPE